MSRQDIGSQAVESPQTAWESIDTPLSPSLARHVEVRNERIKQLLSTQIHPYLYANLCERISRFNLVIVPSDVLTEQPQLTSRNLVGDPVDGNVSLLRLEGDAHQTVFWRQEIVLDDLAKSLRLHLRDLGFKVERNDKGMNRRDGAHRSPLEAQPNLQAQTDPTRRKPPRPLSLPSYSWFKKKICAPSPDHDPTLTRKYKLGWRANSCNKDNDDGEEGNEQDDLNNDNDRRKSQHDAYDFDNDNMMMMPKDNSKMKRASNTSPPTSPSSSSNKRSSQRSSRSSIMKMQTKKEKKKHLSSNEIRLHVKPRDVSFHFTTTMARRSTVTAEVVWIEVEVGA